MSRGREYYNRQVAKAKREIESTKDIITEWKRIGKIEKILIAIYLGVAVGKYINKDYDVSFFVYIGLTTFMIILKIDNYYCLKRKEEYLESLEDAYYKLIN